VIQEEGGLKLICGLLQQPKDDAQLYAARALIPLSRTGFFLVLSAPKLSLQLIHWNIHNHYVLTASARREMVDLDVFSALARMLKSSDQELPKAASKCLQKLLKDGTPQPWQRWSQPHNKPFSVIFDFFLLMNLKKHPSHGQSDEIRRHGSLVSSGVVMELCEMAKRISNVEALPDAALCMQSITGTGFNPQIHWSTHMLTHQKKAVFFSLMS
jgi:hypothetical protein